MLWEDDFSGLDTSIWTITDNAGFGGNYCQFRSSSVEFRDGSLFLQMEEEESDPELIPVTFKVETTYEDLNPSDIVYLNSSFNGWCGTCEPMTKVGDIWSVTVDLTPGTYEYLFTLNGWDEIGGTPLGSDCDYIPCDEYNNYGFVLYSGTPYVVLEPPCWGSCEACALPTTISNQFENSPPRLLRICDLLGRETNFQPGQLLLYYYSDGRVEKKVVWR